MCTQGLSSTHCLGIPYEGYDDGMAPQDVTAGLLGIEKVNGSESGGFGMARYRLASEHMVMRLPVDVSFRHAAAANCTLGCTYTAAEEAGVKAGDVVLVGGVGFIGLGAVANALHRGATVVVLGRNRYRMDLCRRLGATAVIDPGSSNWLEQLHAVTGSRRGADVAFECSGAPYYLDRCMPGLRRYGTLYSLGFTGSEGYSVSIITIACWGGNAYGQSDPPSGSFKAVTAGPSRSGQRPGLSHLAVELPSGRGCGRLLSGPGRGGGMRPSGLG